MRMFAGGSWKPAPVTDDSKECDVLMFFGEIGSGFVR